MEVLAIGAAVAIGCLAFVVVVWLARRGGLRAHEAKLGGAFAGVLVALAAGDLFIDDLRDWWADRPMLSATVGGALLLGLTVLLVDAIVERSRAREVRRTLAHPVVHLLNVAGSGDLHAARQNIQAVPFLDRPERPAMAWTELPETENGLSGLELGAQQVTTTVGQLRLEFLAGGTDLLVYTKRPWRALDGPTAR